MVIASQRGKQKKKKTAEEGIVTRPECKNCANKTNKTQREMKLKCSHVVMFQSVDREMNVDVPFDLSSAVP